MKALSLFLSGLMLMAFMAVNVQAQTTASSEQLATTSNEQPVASSAQPTASSATYKAQKVSSAGILTDTNNVTLGTIESNGILKNANGMIVGKVLPNKKDPTMYDVYNKSSKIIATVGPHGMVKDLSGRIMYNVEEPDEKGYCKVYDSKNNLVGIVHETRKHEGASLMYCRKK